MAQTERDMARECLTWQALSAKTLPEVSAAEQALHEWIAKYPEEREWMRDAFEQLSLMRDAAEEAAEHVQAAANSEQATKVA